MGKYNRHVQLIRMAAVESSAVIWSQYACTRCQLAQCRLTRECDDPGIPVTPSHCKHKCRVNETTQEGHLTTGDGAPGPAVW